MREIVLNGLEKDFRSNEAYKNLRTNIEFSGEENKVLVFTSCTPNEGKSTVSLSVASSLAESGKKFSLLMRICVNLFWQGVTEYRAS